MRLIDADKLKGQLRGHYSGVVGYVDEDDIDAAPTVYLDKWQAEGEPGMVKAQRERAERLRWMLDYAMRSGINAVASTEEKRLAMVQEVVDERLADLDRRWKERE